MAQEGNRSNVGRTLVHQPICLQFRRWGNCRFGEKCRYIHTTGRSTYGPPQGVGRAQRYLQAGKGEQRETTAITIGTAGNEVKNKSYSDNVEPKMPVDFRRNLMMKTRLCIRWERDGRCPYGSRCQFAHGKRELRVVGHSNPLVSLSSAGISAPAENVASNETGSSAGISAPAENVASIETGSSAGISTPAENVAPNETGFSAGMSAPAENVAPNETGSRAPSKLRFKWNDVHKINRIYGDWIE